MKASTTRTGLSSPRSRPSNPAARSAGSGLDPQQNASSRSPRTPRENTRLGVFTQAGPQAAHHCQPAKSAGTPVENARLTTAPGVDRTHKLRTHVDVRPMKRLGRGSHEAPKCAYNGEIASTMIKQPEKNPGCAILYFYMFLLTTLAFTRRGEPVTAASPLGRCLGSGIGVRTHRMSFGWSSDPSKSAPSWR